jgi:hypothetical protein
MIASFACLASMSAVRLGKAIKIGASAPISFLALGVKSDATGPWSWISGKLVEVLTVRRHLDELSQLA